MTKYLITGGCGFMGANLGSETLRRGGELVIFDNLSRYGSTDNLKWLKKQGKFNFIYGDVRNNHDLAAAVRTVKPDVVFHLAGQVAMTTSLKSPRLDFETNVLGTVNLLESIREYAPDATVLYSSTNKVYGDLDWITYKEVPTRYEAVGYSAGFGEDLPFDPVTPYGVSKGSADRYMLDYAKCFDLRTVVFRHSSMYGGRQFATVDQGWIGWFCQKAIDVRSGHNNTIRISGDGKQVRDLLHSDDICNLYFAAASNVERISGKAFNIGGGMANSLSLIELLNYLQSYLDVDFDVVNGPTRSSDQKVFVADDRRIREHLDYCVSVTYEVGLKMMIDWISGLSK